MPLPPPVFSHPPAFRRHFRFLYRLVPREMLASPATLWRAENLLTALCLISILCPPFALLYLHLGDPVSSSYFVYSTIGGIAAIVALKFGEHLAASREIATLTLFSLLFALTLRLGGNDAPTIMWFAFCPLIAMTVGGFKPGFTWAGVVGVALLVIHYLEVNQQLPAPVISDMPLLEIVSSIAYVLTIMIHLSMTEKTHATAIMSLDDAVKRINELAIRDELTGVLNRREVLRLAEFERNMTGRSGPPFCLCVIDLDHFKSINDNFGHGAGDQVLKTVANCIQSQIRNVDAFGRYGGEEFLLLLTATDVRSASDSCERLRRHIECIQWTAPLDRTSVTASMGIAQYSNGETIDQTIARADQALYRAKRAGRNQVAASKKLKSRPAR